MFLACKILSKTVSGHLFCRDLLDVNLAALDCLAYPHLLDIYIAEFSLKTFCRLSNYANCLSVIAVDCWFDIWIEVEFRKEIYPPDDL